MVFFFNLLDLFFRRRHGVLQSGTIVPRQQGQGLPVRFRLPQTPHGLARAAQKFERNLRLVLQGVRTDRVEAQRVVEVETFAGTELRLIQISRSFVPASLVILVLTRL